MEANVRVYITWRKQEESVSNIKKKKIATTSS